MVRCLLKGQVQQLDPPPQHDTRTRSQQQDPRRSSSSENMIRMFSLLYVCMSQLISAFTNINPSVHRHIISSRRDVDTDTSNSSLASKKENCQFDEKNESDGACLLFPGGGLFFYWQAGVIVSLTRVCFLFITCRPRMLINSLRSY